MSDPVKVFIDQNNMATFQCHECGKSKTADVSQYKDVEKTVHVKIKCPCGNAYTAILERRKFFRKDLHLDGVYKSANLSSQGKMTVLDLSRSGMKIKLDIESKIHIGDKLKLDFYLDNKQHSFISREGTVRSIDNRVIGVEFISREHYDELGPYIRYNLNS